jgi:hypothetical protein
MRQAPRRNRAGVLLPKRKRSTYIPGVGYTPVRSIFPSSARRSYGIGETKFIDNYLAAGTIPNTQGVNSVRPTTGDTVTPAVAIAAANAGLLQIVQGDTEYERNGREITVKAIQGRLLVALQTGTSFADLYRIMLVHDRQANGAAFTLNNVLDYTGNTPNEFSFNNLENSKRFQVLMDVFRPINVGATTAANGVDGVATFHVIRFNKRVNIPIMYDSTANTGALTTIRSSNLALLCISASGACNLSGTVRIRYTDH